MFTVLGRFATAYPKIGFQTGHQGDILSYRHRFPLKAENLLHNGSAVFKKSEFSDKAVDIESNCNKERSMHQIDDNDAEADALLPPRCVQQPCSRDDNRYKMVAKNHVGGSTNRSYNSTGCTKHTVVTQEEWAPQNEETLPNEKDTDSIMNENSSDEKETADLFITSNETADSSNKKAAISNQEETSSSDYPNASTEKSVARPKTNSLANNKLSSNSEEPTAVRQNLNLSNECSASLEEMAISESLANKAWTRLCVSLISFPTNNMIADCVNLPASNKREITSSISSTSSETGQTVSTPNLASNGKSAASQMPSASSQKYKSSFKNLSYLCEDPIAYKKVTCSRIDSPIDEPIDPNKRMADFKQTNSRTEHVDRTQTTASQFNKEPAAHNNNENVCKTELSGQRDSKCNKNQIQVGATWTNSNEKHTIATNRPVGFSRKLIILCEKVSGFCSRLIVSSKKPDAKDQHTQCRKKPNGKA